MKRIIFSKLVIGNCGVDRRGPTSGPDSTSVKADEALFLIRHHKPDVLFLEPRSQENKIAVPTNDGLEFLLISDIIRIESVSYYSNLFLVNGQVTLVTRLLKDFEELLAPYRFFRVHNSHLVNLRYIRKFSRSEGGQVVMENGDVVDVSRRRREEFLKYLQQ
jgi:DNA-binding LytR/AlgR family response regulator